jgi:L-threonylcarbamoyladenylate synthase
MTRSDPELIGADDPKALDAAVRVLLAGGTVVLPTDTIYGVAALAALPDATERLFVLKDRSEGVPIAVLVADADQARSVAETDITEVVRWMDQLWPGPLTLVLPRATSAVELSLGGDGDTVGVRCPDHALLRAIAAEVGPVATTSANRHGTATPTTALEAAASLAGPVDLVIDGGPSGTVASTVVDATWGTWRILREGAITADRLR